MTGAAFKSKLTLVIAFGLFVIAAVCPSARAAERLVSACSDGFAFSPDPFLASQPEDAWRFSPICRGPMMLSSAIPAGSQWSSWWRFPMTPFSSNVRITAVSFGLSGSDGSDGGAGNRVQGVTTCAAGQCGALVRPSGPDVLTPEHHEMRVNDGSLAENTDEFRVVGSCSALDGIQEPVVCEPGRPLYIWDLAFVIDDNEPPTISRIADEGPSSATPLVENGWNGIGDHVITINAQDSGLGVHDLQFMFNATLGQNGTLYYRDTGCGDHYHLFDELLRYCDLSADVAFVFGSTAPGIQPGPNVLNVSAFDAAGNQSAGTDVHFKLDRLLPVPARLSATTPFLNGWQADPVVNLTWSNGQDAYETATNSQVVRATAWVVKYGNINASSSATKTVSGTNVEELNGLRLPSAGLWRIRFRVWDEAGNASDYHEVQVGVDYQAPDAPSITPPGTVGGAALASGFGIKWKPPPPPQAGICGYAMSIDQSPAADPGTEIGYPAGAVAAQLPHVLPEGENFVHLRAISCAGIPGQIVNTAFVVDAAGPGIRLTRPSPSGWYDPSNPLVAEIDQEVNARLAVSVDGGLPSWYDQTRVSIPLEDGIHLVTLLAEDALGNRTQRTLSVNCDTSPPSAVFDPVDWSDPTLVTAQVRDDGSGVSAVQLEYRRVGETDWHGLGLPTFTADKSSSLTVALRFPDESLADGVYDMRVIAFDATGQRTSAQTHSDGSPAIRKLPLRTPANLKAGFSTTVTARRCARKGKYRRCRSVKKTTIESRKLVGFGTTAELAGVLRDSSGAAVHGAILKVSESVLGSPRRLTTTVTTDGAGAFHLVPAAGSSRRITVRFDGAATVAPVETDVKLLVEGKVVFDQYPVRARGGSTVTLGGHVIAPGVSIPPDLNVEIQLFVNGSWQGHLVASAVADEDGAFVARVKFPLLRRSVVYRMRAYTPSPQSGWPYEAGVSVSRKLVVTR